MSRYIKMFAAYYFACSTLSAAILTAIDSDTSSPGVMIFIICIYYITYKYIDDNKRSMKRSDIWLLTWWATGCMILINIIFIMAVGAWLFTYDDISINDITSYMTDSGLSPAILAMIIISVIIMHIVIARVGFGLFNWFISKKHITSENS